MIGSRLGSRTRITGSKVGSGADDEGGSGLTGVAQDASSSKYRPANATQWTTTLSAAGLATGNPSHTWLMQVGSGNVPDTIGASDLAAFGAPLYSQVIAGWASLAIGFPDGSSSALFTTGVGDSTTESLLFLGYANLTGVPAASRDGLDFGSGTGRRTMQVNGSGQVLATGAGGQATGTGASNVGTTHRPFILQVNRGGSAFRMVTDQEYVEPAYTAPAGGAATLQVGDSGASSLPIQYSYLALFRGAAAELSRTQIKTLLQTLGWTIPWAP